MNEKKYISLPTSKKLFDTAKKFDFELPESEYVWIGDEDWFKEPDEKRFWKQIEGSLIKIRRRDEVVILDHYYPAYDDYELGEMLPVEINTKNLPQDTTVTDGTTKTRTIFRISDGWGIQYESFPHDPMKMPHFHPITGKTEPEARAAMLIYLIENKLI